nr:xanthine dehydrogenase family protein subunit M [Chloroflexota bacterium]
MFPNQFAYHRPNTLDEALSLLSHEPDAKLLAGGHSLIPAMKLRLAAPQSLIDLGSIERLKSITVKGGVSVGAMTTYKELHESSDLRRAVPMLCEAAGAVGDPQVRARGTLGGSLAHADPAADLTAVFLALRGEVVAVSAEGERTISADSFFVDLWTTELHADEIITELKFPARNGRRGSAYIKHEHPASGYAVVGVAAMLGAEADNKCAWARVAVTGATSKATRALAAEEALSGQPLSEATFDRAAGVAA